VRHARSHPREREAGRPRLQWTREALPQCATTVPPRTSRSTASYCMAPSSPRRVYAFLYGLFQPGEVAMK